MFPAANFIQEIMQMVRSLPLLSSIKMPVLILLSRGATYTDPDSKSGDDDADSGCEDRPD